MSRSGRGEDNLDDFDEDAVRIGVVRETMLTNPLLVKAPLGKPKMTTRNPNEVYGVKSKKEDGGTAAIFHERLSTPLESEAARRAKERNPLLFKSDVGKARKPLSEGVEDMVHGSKTVKDAGVSETISKWWESDKKSQRRREPEVGRAKPPLSASTADKVHGLKHKHEDGGAGQVLSSWVATDSPRRQTTNPLLIKADVGAAKHTLDAGIKERVHGKKSTDPKIEGGVVGAMSNWNRPDTHDANARFNQSSKLYRAELGRARPPVSSRADTVVHGKTNPRDVPGAKDALSNWNPNTPSHPRRHQAEVPKDVAFGKPSQKSEGLSDLIRHNYGKKWLKDQLAKQTQSLHIDTAQQS
ncbi:hypothetical protein PTSG_03559 [Salpingoeca rosetta]|uniref:Uncharacterized protein n=1 Tax=Salpingoeca rosetta (strain ATCC 50818 / BSB-021) TaxID=946362 RepID=F2U5Y5_SALR5|nr:uncharacterized protein PTSG_03559 [Salpingoeca rosetta]EGD82926.1 hypothetical protein PTSG_03559 [Salpingoeca rosetta]|eukprot:XP_004995290.1 hypothetical protein PTSG_03559 [Salpingoeca rosetta]